MSYQVYFVDFSMYHKGKQTDFISFMLFCHVHIKAKTSGFSFDEMLKLTF